MRRQQLNEPEVSDMNEKQIEAVMRAIMLWEGDFPPEWDDIPQSRMDRLRDQAKAAIRAAFTPLKHDEVGDDRTVVMKSSTYG